MEINILSKETLNLEISFRVKLETATSFHHLQVLLKNQREFKLYSVHSRQMIKVFMEQICIKMVSRCKLSLMISLYVLKIVMKLRLLRLMDLSFG